MDTSQAFVAMTQELLTLSPPEEDSAPKNTFLFNIHLQYQALSKNDEVTGINITALPMHELTAANLPVRYPHIDDRSLKEYLEILYSSDLFECAKTGSAIQRASASCLIRAMESFIGFFVKIVEPALWRLFWVSEFSGGPGRILKEYTYENMVEWKQKFDRALLVENKTFRMDEVTDWHYYDASYTAFSSVGEDRPSTYTFWFQICRLAFRGIFLPIIFNEGVTDVNLGARPREGYVLRRRLGARLLREEQVQLLASVLQKTINTLESICLEILTPEFPSLARLNPFGDSTQADYGSQLCGILWLILESTFEREQMLWNFVLRIRSERTELLILRHLSTASVSGHRVGEENALDVARKVTEKTIRNKNRMMLAFLIEEVNAGGLTGEDLRMARFALMMAPEPEKFLVHWKALVRGHCLELSSRLWFEPEVTGHLLDNDKQ